jgi:hypothetical protein
MLCLRRGTWQEVFKKHTGADSIAHRKIDELLAKLKDLSLLISPGSVSLLVIDELICCF